MKNILFVNQGFDHSVGGPAFSVPLLALGLKKYGYNCIFVSTNWTKNDRNSIISKGGFKWLRFNVIGPRKIMFSPSMFIYITFLLLRKKMVVHLNTPWNLVSLLTYIACRITHTNYIFCLRGSFTKWSLRKGVLHKKIALYLYQQRIIEHATFVHITSHLEKKEFHLLNISAKSQIIPNPIDINESSQSLNKFDSCNKIDLPFNKNYILFYSRVNNKKGLDLLVKCTEFLNKENNVKFVICGVVDDIPYYNYVLNLIQQYDVLDMFIFKGHTNPDLKPYYFSSSDLFVLPSHSENYGMSIAESFVFSTPVIISNNTPWNNLHSKGLGWNVSLCPYEIANCINEFYKLNAKSKSILSKNCKKFIFRHHYTKIASIFNRYYIHYNTKN